MAPLFNLINDEAVKSQDLHYLCHPSGLYYTARTWWRRKAGQEI